MADVYLAKQGSLDRQVAVKILKPSLASDKAYVQRFTVEARAAAGLSHANIVQIHEVGVIDGVHYIVQELIRGKNLAQLLQRSGPLPAPFVARIMAHVTAALGRASEQKIVHRDIKPENIMIGASGDVKVTDFGLARDLVRGADLTQTGMAMGTPLYMSPEQVEGGTLDVRSDLYALGATAYHLLTGVPPFQGDSAISVAIKHLREAPTAIAALRDDVPAPLCDIVQKLLQKKPDDRFQSTRELLKALRSLPFDWNEEADNWSTWKTESDGPSPGNTLEATWRLQSAMTQSVQQQSAPKKKWRLSNRLAIAALLGGLVLGFITDPRGPARYFQTFTAKDQGDVWKTLFHARMTGSPAVWESVLKFYANDEFARSLALRELGEIYLKQKAYGQARGYYVRLLGSNTSNDRVVGAAGLAIITHESPGNVGINSRDITQTLNDESLEVLRQDSPWLFAQLQSITSELNNARE